MQSREEDATPRRASQGIDKAVGLGVDALSQRLSRRGVLAKLGKVCLAALGVGFAQETLPAVRGVADATHPGACNQPYLCNLDGRWCACDGCSGTLYACPNCASIGGSWNYCCSGYRVYYRDCFRGSCGNQKYHNCRNCHECSNGPQRGIYGGSAADYLCTMVDVNFSQPC
jgi:hypothetical protein